MRIAQKLSLGFLCTSLLLALLGGFTLKTNWKLEKETDRVVNHTLVETENFAKIVDYFLEIDDRCHEVYLESIADNNQNILNYSVLKEFEDTLVKITQKLSESKKSELVAQHSLAIETEQTSTNKSDLQLLEQIETKFAVYQQNLETYLDMMATDPNAAYQFYVESTDEQLENELLPLLKEYQNSHFQQLRSEALDVEHSLIQENLLVALFIVISISTALGLGLVISDSIAKPLKQLEKTASDIKDGKLDTVLNLDTDRIVAAQQILRQA